MSLKKTMSMLLGTVMLTVLLQVAVFGAPSVAGITDSADEGTSGEALIFSDSTVEIDIGARQSETNVRYVEIDGVQTEITENNNKCFVDVGNTNVLVEVTEKTSASASAVVKTQYYYIEVAKKTYTKLDMDTYMQSYEEKAIRTTGEKGIRFKAHVLTDAKLEETQFIIDEYGYIVATQEALGTQDLTLNFSKYVRGVGFNRDAGINIVFDSTNDDYDVFTLVLKNIPVENYKTRLVCKTYTKLRIQGRPFVVYGEPMVGSAFDVASDYFAADHTNLEIANMIFDYVSYEGIDTETFADGYVVSGISNSTVSVNGAFSSTASAGETYNVYLLTYSRYGTLVDIKKSDDLKVVSGYNNFSASFELTSDEKQSKAVVLTSDLVSVCEENIIKWQPTESAFYETLASTAFTSSTDFSTYFNPDSEINYVESLALMSNIHARYNNTEVTEREGVEYNYIIEMDDPEFLIDLSERNSRNDDRINFNRATGEIDAENGYLVGTAEMKDNGGYDPQVVINGLDLDSRKFAKIVIRMKLEEVEGYNVNFAGQVCQIFFKTTFESSFSEAKSFKYSLGKVSDLNDWFEIEIDVGDSSFWNIKKPSSSYPTVTGDLWKDVITGIRVDPVNCNAKFYIDYVQFTQGDSSFNSSWYDVYLDYAVDNGFAKIGEVPFSEFTTKNTTKSEFILMLIDAFGEEAFPTINEIDALPDIEKNQKYSDLYLLMYRAGITLGFDENGNLSPETPLTRSQAASIANKLFVADNRIKGTVNASWGGDEYKYDIEFNTASDINKFIYRSQVASKEIVDGSLKVVANNWDAGMYMDGVSIDADAFTKIRVRLKAEYVGEPNDSGRTASIFYKPKVGYSGSLDNYQVNVIVTDYYLDPLGWYVFELDMSTDPKWKGEISYFRFDTMNQIGTYTIDYIRFIKSPYADLPTQADLIAAGYTAKNLMPDGFGDGFYVSRVDQSVTWANMQSTNRKVTFKDSVNDPVWTLGPWWQGTGEGFTEIDLWENKIISDDGYTISDSYGVNTVTYNPELDSITQRLDATKIYNGQPHDADTYKWWPHQLLDTNSNFKENVDMAYNSADADRMFVELDIRMLDYNPTTNTEGMNVCSYLAYFYLRPKKDPGQLIWFGLGLFSGQSLSAPTNVRPNWSPDSAAHQYMYGMPQAVVYDGIENSFNPSAGVADVGEEWKHIRLDITPHVDRAIEWANRDNIFGFEVTREDMFWNGVNIGYEIHGNFDVTFEIKNLNLIAYNAPEEE